MDTPTIAVSNYFEVKDEKAFFEWCKTIPGLRCEKAPLTDDGLAHGVAVWSEDGFWTTMIDDPATVECRDVDMPKELQKHLKDGSVAILMHSSADEDAIGYSCAITPGKEIVWVSIYDIVDKARKVFGIENIGAV